MSDGCYCEWSEGELPEWMHYRMRKARKEHVCCECREPIKKGEQFEYTSGKWDGRIQAFKTCAYCANLRAVLVSKFCDGVAFGDLACVAMSYPEIEPVTAEPLK